MIKINYPITNEDRKKMEDAYFEMFKKQETEFNTAKASLSGTLRTFFNTLDYRQIVLGKIEELVPIYNGYINLPTDQDKTTVNNHFKDIFSYDQSKISKFFEDYNHIFQLKACHYCNMDSVHVYSSIGGFFDELDFIRYAGEKELCEIDGIGKDTAKKVVELPERKKLKLTSLPKAAAKVYKMIMGYDVKRIGYSDEWDFIKRASVPEMKNVPEIGKKKAEKIFNHRTSANFMELAEVNSLYRILIGYRGINRNHFTLDHYIPQKLCCLFARSLYNFVPSCYVCNSKLKGVKLLSNDNSQLHTCCSTYDAYDPEANLQFSLVQKNVVDIFDYHTTERELLLQNFEIDIESLNANNRMIEVLNLRQRYSLYKDKAIKLAYLKERYSPQTLGEISRILSRSYKITESELEKDIFCPPESENESFSKLFRDIKKQLRIKTRNSN